MKLGSGGSRSGRSVRPVALGVLVAAGAAVVASVVPAGASQPSAKVKAEEAHAKQALLVRSDFPAAWTSQGRVTTDDSNGSDANFPGGNELVSCIGISSYLANLATPTANSPTFGTNGDEKTVQDSVNIFPSTKVAAEANAAISGPKVPGCMATALQGPAKQSIVNAMGNGITVGTISVAATDPALLIPHSSGFTISFPATYQGVTLQTQVMIISLFRGKSDSQLTLTSVLDPFSKTMARHLETVAAGRT
jgi:hypothetical protein